MRSRALRKVSLTVLAGMALLCSASADVGFGSRAAGMAGVGIALPRFGSHSGRLNPAAYGMMNSKGFRIGWPTLALREKDITLSEVRDLIGTTSGGGIDSSGAKKLLQKFASQNRELGAITYFGLGGGNFEVSADVQLAAKSIPNATLQTWDNFVRNTLGINLDDPNGLQQALNELAKNAVNVGGQILDFANNAAGDVYGYGFASTNLSFGVPVNTTGQGKLSVGATARIVSAYYTHFSANGMQIATSNEIPRAQEMAGQDVLHKTGFGMDLGGMYSLPNGGTVGLVIHNLIRPAIKINGTGPRGPLAQIGPAQDVNPFKTAVSVGWGNDVNENFTYGVDWYDMSNATKNGELRMGVEYRMKAFAVRAGYGTRLKGSVGFSVVGLDFNFSKEMPAYIGAAFRF